MADQQVERLAPPNDSEIEWTKAVSKNGVPFEHGMLKADLERSRKEAAENPETQQADANAHKWQKVRWTVGDDVWTYTNEVEGISRYALYRINNPIYDYMLEFTNYGYWGFDFEDETGDVYSVTTVLNRDHYLKYNSSKPTIINVKAF